MRVLGLLLLLLVGSPWAFAQTKAAPPHQPALGPGGAEYRHGRVTQSVYATGDQQYWIFEPADPKPPKAPLIVFNHGWSAMNPKVYGAWIEHIVRRGNVVVYPRYQADLRTPTREFTPNAIAAVKDAIKRLQRSNHVKPQLDKFAIVGHSAGAQVTANMSALANSSGLPPPRAAMTIQPGKSWSMSPRIAIPLDDLSQIPSHLLLLAVVGDQDRVVRDIDAKRIIKESIRVPASNKALIIIVSDQHGEPPLTASHFSPAAVDDKYDSGEKLRRRREGTRKGLLQGLLKRRVQSRLGEQKLPQITEEGFPDPEQAEAQSVNALDYYGFWKLFDALCDAAFYGRNREYALGDTSQQRFMGNWSDGKPVKELVVLQEGEI